MGAFFQKMSIFVIYLMTFHRKQLFLDFVKFQSTKYTYVQ